MYAAGLLSDETGAGFFLQVLAIRIDNIDFLFAQPEAQLPVPDGRPECPLDRQPSALSGPVAGSACLTHSVCTRWPLHFFANAPDASDVPCLTCGSDVVDVWAHVLKFCPTLTSITVTRRGQNGVVAQGHGNTRSGATGDSLEDNRPDVHWFRIQGCVRASPAAPEQELTNESLR